MISQPFTYKTLQLATLTKWTTKSPKSKGKELDDNETNIDDTPNLLTTSLFRLGRLHVLFTSLIAGQPSLPFNF